MYISIMYYLLPIFLNSAYAAQITYTLNSDPVYAFQYLFTNLKILGSHK